MRRLVCMNFSPFVPPVETSSRDSGSASVLVWSAIIEPASCHALLSLGSHACRAFGQIMSFAKFVVRRSEGVHDLRRHGLHGFAARTCGVSDYTHRLFNH